MITAVDTNIFIDILEPDPIHGPPSKEMLKQCLREGTVVACEVVWAEAATAFGHDQEKLIEVLQSMGVEYLSMNLDAALAAAERWYEYRKKGGKKDRIAADFLIGGHALIQCDRLLTRDRGFYRSYFVSLEVLSP